MTDFSKPAPSIRIIEGKKWGAEWEKKKRNRGKDVSSLLQPVPYFLDFAAPHHLNSGKQLHQYPGANKTGFRQRNDMPF